MRLLTCAAVALTLLVPGSALAADAARLAGTTTLRAAGSSYIPIQIDQPVRVVLASENRAEEAKVKLEGGGLFAGMVLRLDDPSESAPGIMALRTPTFDLPWVSALGKPVEELTNTRYAVTLPAGRYRLFAITTDRAVGATLSLPGLEGVADLSPTVAIPAVGEPLERRTPAPLENFVIAGQSHPLTSTGLVSVELLTESLVGAAQQVELCTYAPGADSTGAGAFAPTCPGGEPSNWLPSIAGSGYGLGTHFVAGKGDWGLGGNVEAAAAPATTVGYGLWVSFDGTPIPGATIPDPPGTAPAAAPPPADTPAPLEHGIPVDETGGAAAGEKPAPVSRKKRAKRPCPKVTRRSSKAQRRKAARCRAARRRAARRRS